MADWGGCKGLALKELEWGKKGVFPKSIQSRKGEAGRGSEKTWGVSGGSIRKDSRKQSR